MKYLLFVAIFVAVYIPVRYGIRSCGPCLPVCDPQKNPDARAAPGFLFYSAAVTSAASAGSSSAGGVVPPVCSGVPLVLLKTSLDSLEKTSFAYST